MTRPPRHRTDQEVLITRIFDAPRERVFKAWTDPDEVAAWYGPEHMDAPRERIQHRPARRWALGADDGSSRRRRRVRYRL